MLPAKTSARSLRPRKPPERFGIPGANRTIDRTSFSSVSPVVAADRFVTEREEFYKWFSFVKRKSPFETTYNIVEHVFFFFSVNFMKKNRIHPLYTGSNRNFRSEARRVTTSYENLLVVTR